ncbi:MAG: hypothetical protein ACR2P1_13550 [Pseudomonadales bacterium]
MSEQKITPEQVRKIEDALEERKKLDRRTEPTAVPEDFNRREQVKDRRKSK